MQKPYIVAHRGASFYEPENTLRAFELGIKQGADFIECDVRLSADGHLVIMHDPTLGRTTNGRGKIAKTTLSELRKLDAGKGEKIPLLGEVLDLAKQNNVGIIIEIKVSFAEKQVVELLVQEKMIEKTVVISFLFSVLHKCHELFPDLRTGFLFKAWDRASMWLASRVKAKLLCPRADFLTAKTVEKAHKKNFEIMTWTVNNEEEMKRAVGLGVDYIGTDKPDVLQRILTRRPNG